MEQARIQPFNSQRHRVDFAIARRFPTRDGRETPWPWALCKVSRPGEERDTNPYIFRSDAGAAG